MPEQKKEIVVVYVPIGDLKPSEYNPRKMGKKEAEELKKSLTTFGFVEPIIVNKNPERKNIIIGGHQRFNLAKMMGYTELPVHFLNLSLTQERELNLRLNKNNGEFDFELLADFDEEVLRSVGFTEAEMDKAFQLSIGGEDGEIEFTKEMFEENNYIVFVFNNEFDWNTVENELELKPVLIREVGGNVKRGGMGRVLKGEKLIKLINTKNKL